MAQEFYNYNPDQVIVSFAGSVLRGLISIRRRSLAAGFTSKAGMDKLVSHSRTNDPREEFEVTCMAGSATNDVLSAVHELDLVAPNGAGVGPLSLVDLNGRTIVECTYARVMKAPDDEFTAEDGERPWVLEGVRSARVVGGR